MWQRFLFYLKKVLKVVPKINIVLPFTDTLTKDYISVKQHKMQYNTSFAMQHNAIQHLAGD